MRKITRSALGFRAHSGWAAVVALGGSVDAPMVLLRTRIELADPAMPGSIQPYHAAAALEKVAAGRLIRRCRASTNAMARRAVRTVMAELQKKGHIPVACGNLLASGRSPASLAAALASHLMLHTAEGELFRDSLDGASRHLGLKVTSIREREALEFGSAVFGIASEQLRRKLNEMGRLVGPPWRQDEKLATLAAWIALAEGSKSTITGSFGTRSRK
jgi:hypothetical protein